MDINKFKIMQQKGIESYSESAVKPVILNKNVVSFLTTMFYIRFSNFNAGIPISTLMC